ncbi:MAG: cysteine desulfurase family protein [Pseudomonadota bacterium]
MAGTRRIYFDNAATTPVDPQVAREMQPFLHENFGNPSSLYKEGLEARQAVELARHQVAWLLGCKQSEVVFTGSGTEADNMAITGVFRAFQGKPFHLITSPIEHPAVLEVCKYLAACGASVSFLPVASDGIVSPDDLVKALRPETRLISIMAANNVTGALQPVAELGSIARERNILFHTDAVQAAGKIPINMEANRIDLLSLSGHKMYGPKGVGVLIIREGTPLSPLILGGGQEGGRRSATENVAGIVGLGKACSLSLADMADDAAREVRLRERLIEGIEGLLPNAYLIGHRYRRLPGHICLGLQAMEGEAMKMLLALDEHGFAVSTGSACSSHKAHDPSYVLSAMGFDPFRARGALRITLGRFNTENDVDAFLEIFPKVIAGLRSIKSYYHTIKEIKNDTTGIHLTDA